MVSRLNCNTSIPLPSQKYLRECINYDPDTGTLTWNIRPLHHFKNSHGMNTFNSKFSGKTINSMVNGRYFVVRLNGVSYLAHRVIWKFMTGTDPSKNIDHIDTNKTNNAWINLRLATKQENAFNQQISARNTTGYKGVSFDRKRNKFFASIAINGKTKALGRFDSAELAHKAYISASAEMHGEFGRVQ